MSNDTPGSITRLLRAASKGDAAALQQLWALIYDELRKLAHAQLAREGPGCELQTTALINEAFVRLADKDPELWQNRRHLFGIVWSAMRQILIDDARKRKGVKRGGGQRPEPLGTDPESPPADLDTLLAVDEAMQRLKEADPLKAEVVILRYFAGKTVDETAEILGISPRTVDTEWRFARAWLLRELSRGDTTTG